MCDHARARRGRSQPPAAMRRTGVVVAGTPDRTADVAGPGGRGRGDFGRDAAGVVLRTLAPMDTFGVVYLLGALVVAIGWGTGLAAVTSVVSALALGYFRDWPNDSFDPTDLRNWVVIGVFLVVTLMANTLAGVARARAAEADAQRRAAGCAATCRDRGGAGCSARRRVLNGDNGVGARASRRARRAVSLRTRRHRRAGCGPRRIRRAADVGRRTLPARGRQRRGESVARGSDRPDRRRRQGMGRGRGEFLSRPTVSRRHRGAPHGLR